MTDANEKLSDGEVGERLRIAREEAGKTQSAAADAAAVARTTIVAIEKGQRRIRLEELQKLAVFYGTSANAILRREAVQLDLVPRFRKLAQDADPAVENASRLLNDLVRAEVELEDALGIRRPRNYPPERPILPGDVRLQAEQDAQELRDWLGLGPGSILDIVAVLDLQLGIRIYLRRLEGRISGLFAFDDRAGACMLLNANHPVERLTHTALHELAHFVSARQKPEVLADDAPGASREERYADTFARSFAMPGRPVCQRFAEITAGQTHLTRRHVILLAYTFGVSREAMVRRLEELKLARSGTWDWFQSNGGINGEHVLQVLGEAAERSAPSIEGRALVPHRLGLLAREAWKRSIYSEGQLARLLRLDRHEMRQVLDGAEAEESEAHDFVKLSH